MIFAVRAVQQPIPGFAITVTESQLLLIQRFLHMDVPADLDNAPPHFSADLHSICWSMMTSIPVSSGLNELEIPLTRFLISYHLRDGSTSRFKPAGHVCHNMIAIQWCWRAMALYHCKQLASKDTKGEIG